MKTVYVRVIVPALTLVLHVSTVPTTRAQQTTEPGQEGSETANSVSVPHAELLAGAGITTRSLRFGSAAANRALDTGVVPALAIELESHVGQQWFCQLRLAYRSSVFAEGSQQAPSAASAITTTLQSHEFIGGLEPGVHFGGIHSASVAVFAGYGVRAFGSVVELAIPRFSLHGPVIRTALALPLWGGRFELRLAPEVHIIVGQTLALREDARTERQGFALGVEASARLVLDWLALQASYRESHARIASAWPTQFSDVERFALFSVGLLYN